MITTDSSDNVVVWVAFFFLLPNKLAMMSGWSLAALRRALETSGLVTRSMMDSRSRSTERLVFQGW